MTMNVDPTMGIYKCIYTGNLNGCQDSLARLLDSF
jgi:hypothetical protein